MGACYVTVLHSWHQNLIKYLILYNSMYIVSKSGEFFLQFWMHSSTLNTMENKNIAQV